jgi:hypothetical protein
MSCSVGRTDFDSRGANLAATWTGSAPRHVPRRMPQPSEDAGRSSVSRSQRAVPAHELALVRRRDTARSDGDQGNEEQGCSHSSFPRPMRGRRRWPSRLGSPGTGRALGVPSPPHVADGLPLVDSDAPPLAAAGPWPRRGRPSRRVRTRRHPRPARVRPAAAPTASTPNRRSRGRRIRFHERRGGGHAAQGAVHRASCSSSRPAARRSRRPALARRRRLAVSRSLAPCRPLVVAAAAVGAARSAGRRRRTDRRREASHDRGGASPRPSQRCHDPSAKLSTRSSRSTLRCRCPVRTDLSDRYSRSPGRAVSLLWGAQQ